MLNAIHPDRMTTTERLDEAAEILTLGIRRLRGKSNKIKEFGEISLDFAGGRSMHGHETR
jgi:hypothetical protein